jgi:hypothetical protein
MLELCLGLREYHYYPYGHQRVNTRGAEILRGLNVVRGKKPKRFQEHPARSQSSEVLEFGLGAAMRASCPLSRVPDAMLVSVCEMENGDSLRRTRDVYEKQAGYRRLEGIAIESAKANPLETRRIMAIENRLGYLQKTMWQNEGISRDVTQNKEDQKMTWIKFRDSP